MESLTLQQCVLVIKTFYENRSSKSDDVDWSPRSPDLTASDFFLYMGAI
jgi:hypothetical protein